ncbi:MAG: VOC family protein [Candidatus Bathyarchaeota archaeon]|nr:VOC family protein [Candidatus Bathyarchaeota archaeon]
MVHNICHIEIPVTDIRRAGEFYSKLFGWKIDYGMANYAIFTPEEGLAGGLDKVEKVTPGGVIFYVAVEDIPKTLKRAQELGAEMVKEKTEIPNVGWFGLFSDLDGNIIGIFTSKTE